MLAKRERLSRAAFNTFFQRGRRVSGVHMRLIYAPYHTTHGAVVVSKKVARRAVDRNRIRRRVYAMLRELLRRDECTGVFIIIVHDNLKDVSAEALRTDITKLITRVI